MQITNIGDLNQLGLGGLFPIYLWELFAFRRPHLQIIWNQSPINLENADLKNILFFDYKVDYFIFPSSFIPLMSPFFIF